MKLLQALFRHESFLLTGLLSLMYPDKIRIMKLLTGREFHLELYGLLWLNQWITVISNDSTICISSNILVVWWGLISIIWDIRWLVISHFI